MGVEILVFNYTISLDRDLNVMKAPRPPTSLLLVLLLLLLPVTQCDILRVPSFQVNSSPVPTNSTNNVIDVGMGMSPVIKIPLSPIMTGKVKVGQEQVQLLFASERRVGWVLGHTKENKKFLKGDGFHHHYYVQGNLDDLLMQRYVETYDEEYQMVISGELSSELVVAGGKVVNDCVVCIVDGLKGTRPELTNFDGVFSLGRLEPNPTTAKHERAMSQFLQMNLEKTLFSVYMSHDGTSNHILFGGIDPEYSKPGTLHMVDVVHRSADKTEEDTAAGGWWVSVERVLFRSNTLDYNLTGVFATGYPYVRLPRRLYRSVSTTLEHIFPEHYDELVKHPQVPCALVDTLPRLSLAMGSERFTLAGPEYTAPSGYGTDAGDPLCSLLLEPEPNGSAHAQRRITIGHPFLRKFYTVYFHNHNDGAGAGDGDGAGLGGGVQSHGESGGEGVDGVEKAEAKFRPRIGIATARSNAPSGKKEDKKGMKKNKKNKKSNSQAMQQ